MKVLSESAKKNIALLNGTVSIVNLAVLAPYSLYLVYVSLNADAPAARLLLLATSYLTVSILAGSLVFLERKKYQKALALAVLAGHACVFASVLFQLQSRHASWGWADWLATYWPAFLSSVLTIVFLSIAFVIQKRPFRGRLPCPVCGYETEGLDKCPECGRSVQNEFGEINA